ncbi:MAG: hypothetical protein WDO56_02035 [Gammaproteobacteria bacterium]
MFTPVGFEGVDVISLENISLTDPKLQGDDVVVKAEALATAFHSVADAKPTPGDKRGAAIAGAEVSARLALWFALCASLAAACSSDPVVTPSRLRAPRT